MAAAVMTFRQSSQINDANNNINMESQLFGSPSKSKFSLPGFLRRSRSGSSSTEGNSCSESTTRKGSVALNQGDGVSSSNNSSSSGFKNNYGGQDSSSKKSNIYRRPGIAAQKSKQATSSNINSLGWSGSVASSKRKQFAQRTHRMLWMNESIDVDDDEEDSDLVEYGDDAKLAYGMEADISRHRRLSVASSPNSIIKKLSESPPEYDVDCSSNNTLQRPRKDAEVRKQTSFKDSVKVYHYDHSDTVSTREQKLKESDRRQGHVKDTTNSSSLDTRDNADKCQESLQNVGNNASAKSNHSNDIRSEKGTVPSLNRMSRDNSTNQIDNNIGDSVTIFQSVRVEVLENEDGNCEAIRLFLNLKDEVDSSETSVKAMSGGSSLLVFTQYRSDSTEGAQCEQFAEKVTLPLKVDPCSVKAFVHKSGCLIIDARLAWNGF